jgi:hypothetical protein
VWQCAVWQCASVCVSVRQCAAVCSSAVVCGSVWQCEPQWVSVLAAVCGSACCSVRQCSSAKVRQYVRQCGRAAER